MACKKKICGQPCDVYSRVVGYYMPLSGWNVGKKSEYADRVPYKVEEGAADVTIAEPSADAVGTGPSQKVS